MYSCEVQSQDGVVTVLLSGELSIYSASPLFSEHVRDLDFSSSLLIDLSGVEEMDTAGMQILLMLLARADKVGKGCEVLSTSPAVDRYLDLFNLQESIPRSGLDLS